MKTFFQLRIPGRFSLTSTSYLDKYNEYDIDEQANWKKMLH